MVSLVANPSNYHGKAVCVSGFLSFGVEQSALFYTSEHMKRDQMKDALWLEIPHAWHVPMRGCDKSFAHVVGRFDMTRQGHFSMFAGSLVDIEYVDIP